MASKSKITKVITTRCEQLKAGPPERQEDKGVLQHFKQRWRQEQTNSDPWAVARRAGFSSTASYPKPSAKPVKKLWTPKVKLPPKHYKKTLSGRNRGASGGGKSIFRVFEKHPDRRLPPWEDWDEEGGVAVEEAEERKEP